MRERESFDHHRHLRLVTPQQERDEESAANNAIAVHARREELRHAHTPYEVLDQMVNDPESNDLSVDAALALMELIEENREKGATGTDLYIDGWEATA